MLAPSHLWHQAACATSHNVADVASRAGCEADAASFTELVETGAAPGSGAEAGCPLFVSGGSYSLGPTHIPSGARSFNIESCFFLNKEQRCDPRVYAGTLTCRSSLNLPPPAMRHLH